MAVFRPQANGSHRRTNLPEPGNNGLLNRLDLDHARLDRRRIPSTPELEPQIERTRLFCLNLALDMHFPTLERDLAFFMGCFSVALLLGLGAPSAVRTPAAIVLVFAYAGYVRRTFRHSGPVETEAEISPLVFDATRSDPPGMTTVLVQLVVALGAIVGGAHLFVEHVLHVADSLGVEPLIISLVLAPFATELPEKANSFFGCVTARIHSHSETSLGRWSSSRRCRFRSASDSPRGNSIPTPFWLVVSLLRVGSSRSSRFRYAAVLVHARSCSGRPCT